MGVLVDSVAANHGPGLPELTNPRSCTVFTRYPLYRESALRKAKKCRLVLGLLKFSALVLVIFLSLVFTQSLRNYWSRGSKKYSPACKNRNEFECENVIKTEFNPSQCDALLFMLDLFISHVLFCCYHCNACLVCLPDTHKLVYICLAWVQSLTIKGGVHVCE